MNQEVRKIKLGNTEVDVEDNDIALTGIILNKDTHEYHAAMKIVGENGNVKYSSQSKQSYKTTSEALELCRQLVVALEDIAEINGFEFPEQTLN